MSNIGTMHAVPAPSPADVFEGALTALDGRLPNADEFRHLTTLTYEPPELDRLQGSDPFSPEYRDAVLGLYLRLRRTTADGYVPERDEAPASSLPEHIWTGLAPWAFRDPPMVGEHLQAWGSILSHIAVPAGGSVLEYGPGSGQLLLILARMGFRACGVDIDAVALNGIGRQAEAMHLTVPTEQARFGEGFGEERFDAIVFYEAFHHALEFEALLRRLHDRLKPGGRLILCGEPVVPETFAGIPYPWGPRLDGLSIFCMRRFGWMELGFTHAFLVEAAGRAGWHVAFHPSATCGRAHLYLLRPAHEVEEPEPEPPSEPVPDPLLEAIAALQTRLAAQDDELAAMRASTSWRLTSPLRLARRMMRAPRR